MAFFEKGPDRVVVLIRHREVAAALVRGLLPVFIAVPVHPLTEPLGLRGLASGEVIYACLAQSDEAVDTGEGIAWDQGFDVAFGLEAKLLFDLDFNPQTLA